MIYRLTGGIMKKIFSLIGLVVGGAAVYLFMTFSPFTKGNTYISTNDIQGKINEIGELATAEYVYTITQTTDKEAVKLLGIDLPFTTSKVIFAYSGTVKAGIDFNRIQISVDEENKVVTVFIPRSEILSNELDNDSLVVYDEKNSPFNQLSFEDMNASQSELKKTAESTATERGLLDSADANARQIVEKTISGFYSSDEYTIEFN